MPSVRVQHDTRYDEQAVAGALSTLGKLAMGKAGCILRLYWTLERGLSAREFPDVMQAASHSGPLRQISSLNFWMDERFRNSQAQA